jgi:hypothetical protein
MEDRYSKYFQLTFNLFFTLLGFIVALALLMLGLKYIFRLLDYIPWFVYVYMMFIFIIPAALFITIFLIYFKRTTQHPSYIIRVISYFIFAVALLVWATAFVRDMITFFKTGAREISNYYSYNIILLASSVAAIFLVGVMQAFTTHKEKDWMDRRKELEQEQQET